MAFSVMEATLMIFFTVPEASIVDVEDRGWCIIWMYSAMEILRSEWRDQCSNSLSPIDLIRNFVVSFELEVYLLSRCKWKIGIEVCRSMIRAFDLALKGAASIQYLKSNNTLSFPWLRRDVVRYGRLLQSYTCCAVFITWPRRHHVFHRSKGTCKRANKPWLHCHFLAVGLHSGIRGAVAVS